MASGWWLERESLGVGHGRGQVPAPGLVIKLERIECFAAVRFVAKIPRAARGSVRPFAELGCFVGLFFAPESQ